MTGVVFQLGNLSLVLAVLLGVGLCLGGCLVLLERGRARRLARFVAPVMLARISRGYHPALRRPLNGLVLCGALALTLALAGPQWGSDATASARGSRAFLILLDTSESMNAVNPAPTRLERARRKITDLVEKHPADRFGLIAFSGGAALQCPLTTDHAYFMTVLHAVDTDTLSEEGTDIEAALQEAATVFAGEDTSGTGDRAGRAVVLVSDGEAVTGDAQRAAEELAQSSAIMVMGIGDPEGAEITLPQALRQSRGSGETALTHLSRLDEGALSDIAVAGGGVYVRSTLGDDDVRILQRELAFLDGASSEEGPGFRRINRYRWPLALALALFVGEALWLSVLPRLARRTESRRAQQ